MDYLSSYFYTDTIFEFKHLLADDNCKQIVIDSWKYLFDNRKIEIYAFVIMPNHINLIWTMLELNGKESPSGSFAKHTAHPFKKYLRNSNPSELSKYASEKADRQFQFWKRDPLAIALTSDKAFLQKLDYIHSNPLADRWSLTVLPEDYRWSSASFYEHGEDEFGILKDFRD